MQRCHTLPLFKAKNIYLQLKCTYVIENSVEQMIKKNPYIVKTSLQACTCKNNRRNRIKSSIYENERRIKKTMSTVKISVDKCSSYDLYVIDIIILLTCYCSNLKKIPLLHYLSFFILCKRIYIKSEDKAK